MCDPTSHVGVSQPRAAGRAWTLPAASVRTTQPADSAWPMTYARASAQAGEKVGRVAPWPGVAVHRAMASMSERILSCETGMIVFPPLPCTQGRGRGEGPSDDRRWLCELPQGSGI